MKYTIKEFIQKLLLIFLVFILTNCSSEPQTEPQPNLKIRLVVDEIEKIAIEAEGEEINVLKEKYADLIDIMDKACNPKDIPKENRDYERQSRTQFFKSNFAAQETVTYEIETDDLKEKLVQSVKMKLSNQGESDISCAQRKSHPRIN